MKSCVCVCVYIHVNAQPKRRKKGSKNKVADTILVTAQWEADVQASYSTYCIHSCILYNSLTHTELINSLTVYKGSHSRQSVGRALLVHSMALLELPLAMQQYHKVSYNNDIWCQKKIK